MNAYEMLLVVIIKTKTKGLRLEIDVTLKE